MPALDLLHASIDVLYTNILTPNMSRSPALTRASTPPDRRVDARGDVGTRRRGAAHTHTSLATITAQAHSRASETERACSDAGRRRVRHARRVDSARRRAAREQCLGGCARAHARWRGWAVAASITVLRTYISTHTQHLALRMHAPVGPSPMQTQCTRQCCC
jgi:hypothetical protein